MEAEEGVSSNHFIEICMKKSIEFVEGPSCFSPPQPHLFLRHGPRDSFIFLPFSRKWANYSHL